MIGAKAIVALIGSAGLSILILVLWDDGAIIQDPIAVNWIGGGLFLVALFVLRRWKPDPILVMLGCGVIGGALYLLTDRTVA